MHILLRKKADCKNVGEIDTGAFKKSICVSFHIKKKRCIQSNRVHKLTYKKAFNTLSYIHDTLLPILNPYLEVTF